MLSAISISAVTVIFTAYYFIVYSSNSIRFFYKRHSEEQAQITYIFFQRLAGVFFFGLLPIALLIGQKIPLHDAGLTFQSKAPVWHWIVGLSLVCVIVNFFASQKEDHLEMYPQIRKPQPWHPQLMVASAVTLFLYTLAYEVMFRGYLLFTCEQELGMLLAIVINTSIYALVHIPKGWKETVGAVPMGIILCWLTLKTGNIWIAVVVHVTLALSSEWFSIYRHKKRSLQKSLAS